MTTATCHQECRELDAVLSAADPAAALASLGVTLVVRRSPLQTPRRTVYGAWDPLLARIELFDCDRRSDAELVATFVHELLHALEKAGQARRVEDAAVHERTVATLGRLSEAELVRLARRLRAAAYPPVVPPGRGDSRVVAPASVPSERGDGCTAEGRV